MYATSNSARAPAARILAAVWTELPSTYFTEDPVAFSNAAAWHFFEFSTKVPPKVATTSSSADAGRARLAASRHVSEILPNVVMIRGSSPSAWWRDYSPAAQSKSTTVTGFRRRVGQRALHTRPGTETPR